jgi:hypothetical protein
MISRKSLLLLMISIMICQFSYSQDENQDEFKKNRILTDKFIINAGIFNPVKKVTVRADGTINTMMDEDIDFDEKIGLSDFETTFTLNFMWRFSKKWRLQAEYFAISNTESAQLTEDVLWNDLVFIKGSSVKGNFSIGLYKVFFSRIISTGDKHEFTGGLGVHLLDVSAYLEGNVMSNMGGLTLQRSEVTVVAPLPNIGLFYIYAPTEKLSFSARVDWFGITIGNIDGSLWNVSPGINYQFFKHLGLGLSYKFIKVDVNVDGDKWKGNFNMSFSGPALTAYYSF